MSHFHRDRMRLLRQQWRTQGYDDGYRNRPARSMAQEYQVSYRRGQEARRNAYKEDGAA